MSASKLPYKRVMLKLSGEMLGGKQKHGIDGEALELLCSEIADLYQEGLQVAVVIGGGNIIRGSLAAQWDIDRSTADYMGMLATVINSLAIQSVLETKYNINTRVMTAIAMQQVAEPYIRRKAIKHLEKGRVVIFAAGTGNPYFTTDTAASLRAIEIGAEIILKATKVNGVYDDDPQKNPNAKKYTTLSYLDVISKKLHVMDATAITMCMEANIPIMVFKLDTKGSVKSALISQSGTMVK